MGKQSITGHLESMTGKIENIQEKSEKLNTKLEDYDEKLDILKSSLESFDQELQKSLEKSKEKLENEKEKLLEQKEKNQKAIDAFNKDFQECKEQYSNELHELREVMRMQDSNEEIYQTMQTRYELLRECQNTLLELKDLGYNVEVNDVLERPESNLDVRCEKKAKEMHEKAYEREPELTGIVTSCAGLVGGTLAGEEFKLKSEKSLADKLKRNVYGGMSPAMASHQICDVNRYTIILENESFVEGFNTVKQTLEAQGYEMIACKNTMQYTELTYRGVNCTIRSPNKSTWELQFHTEQSYQVKEKNHKMYEEQRRETTTKHRKNELSEKMTKRSRKIIAPAGIEQITTFNKKAGRRKRS